MARADSGLETLSLFSDESPCELAATPSSGLGSVSSGTEPAPQPPRISAVLAKGKSVIRPIACKPTAMAPAARFSNTGERYGSTPILARPGSQLTLYGSNNDLRHHHINSNYSLDRKHLSSSASTSSSPPLAVASLSSLPLVSSGKMMGYDSLESVRKSPGPNGVRHSSRANSGKSSSYRHAPGSGESGSLVDLTPSPSDSGVAELEAALRERDSEVQYLRQTMEHNEQVIFRVYQEKERMWERELRRLESVHEGRLRVGAQKALRLEQMLMMQTYQSVPLLQLQQDKKRLKEEADRAQREANELRQEVDLLRGRLEETEWGLCQKSGELSLLKVQIKDSQGEQTTKDHELLQLRGQNRKMKTELEQQEADIEALKTLLSEREKEIASSQAEVERLKSELGAASTKVNQGDADTVSALQTELETLHHERNSEREQFERERLTWAQEKEKVLRYQRQLQLNYVQMFRRTRALEAEIESLTMELELESKSGCPKKKLPAIEMGHTIEL
ncbi:leucine zipper putative tumor suppressor 2 homolog isoform X2 [Anabrus simplex]|uniref:leucine zipper putative tumor suppressor 2 homolog isoform X2 n=1 Tax=Anabrus simplex TaxID=316456 RepID=UPI0034DD8014